MDQAGCYVHYPGARYTRRISQLDWAGAALELRTWVHGGGRVLPGLVARQAEIALMGQQT